MKGFWTPEVKTETVYVEKPVYQVIEVEKPRPIEVNQDIKNSLHGLSLHPGFQYLVNRLKLNKEFWQQKLVQGKHEKMEDVIQLQAAIYWAGWLEAQMSILVKNPSEPSPTELNAFEIARAQLELVGEQDV